MLKIPSVWSALGPDWHCVASSDTLLFFGPAMSND